MNFQCQSYSVCRVFKLMFVVFCLFLIQICSHMNLISIIIISDMLVAFETVNSNLSLFSFVFSTSLIKRNSVEIITSSLSLRKHKLKNENSLIAKIDHDLRLSNSKRRRRHDVLDNDENDEDLTQITSNVFANNDDLESISHEINLKLESHFMSTETQNAHALVTVDKIDLKFENEIESIDENEKNVLMNRYVYSDKQYVYTTC